MVGELQPGDPPAVGPYRLVGRLGGGGMGQVFLGRSTGGRLVAVKVIRPELAGDPGFRARFAREVDAARNVSGVFTAPLVEADVHGPAPWLATGYVDGPSLAEAVADQGPLPAASVLLLAAGLAEGLQAIHRAGMVHRDLKPSNVLLARDGPRVIDFGITRAAEATALTQAGTVIGSPGFMSPEQAEGGAVGPPSDVFSLGAVLAFAATGESPFGTGTTAALLYRVVHGEPDTAGLPAQVRPLVERCLAKDPAARPTPADILAELGAGRLAADWLPASLAAALGRPALPDASSGATGETPTATSAPREPESTVDGIGDEIGVGDEIGGHPPRRSRRRLAWAAAAGAVVIAAAAVAAVALASGTGRPHPSRPSASAAALAHSSPPASPSASPAVTSPAVPDVLGMTLPAASSALKARGFHNIPYLYDCYGSHDIDDVVRQVPAAGARPALTSPVQLYLQADNCRTVPDVIGMNLSNAAYTLKQAGFTNIPYLYDCYGSPDTGAVVRQSPAAGTSYGSNQPVSLKLQANNC